MKVVTHSTNIAAASSPIHGLIEMINKSKRKQIDNMAEIAAVYKYLHKLSLQYVWFTAKAK